MSDTASLPEGFSDLDPYLTKWMVATEAGRNRARRAASMRDIRAFYDAILPRLDKIISYLNQFDLEKMPEPERCLLRLAMSAMEIAPAVELYHQPDVVHAFDAERLEILLDPPT